jgi:hypothetical protein
MRFVLPAVLLLAACADGDDTADEAALEKLAELEDAIEGYESFPQVPEWTGPQPSLDDTHGAYVQIWFTPDFVDVVEDMDGGALPEGSIAVKEGYTDEEADTLTGLFAHVRQEDGTLFYAAWTPEGEATDFGRPDACVDCHVLGQDEVMAITW